MRVYLLGLILCAFSAASYAQSDFPSQIDSLIVPYVQQDMFSGSVLVTNGNQVFKKGYGLANRSWDVSNTPGTRFQIASLTKQFTALIILQLLERGRLLFRDPVIKYIPEFPHSNITIRDLLTHSSGLSNYTEWDEWPDPLSKLDVRPADFIKKIAEKELEFNPGTQFSYSNSNYYILGFVIENITGKTYGRVLEEQVLQPAGLTATGYMFNNLVIERMAEGYDRLQNGFYEKAPYQNPSTAYSASGIYSSVEDLYRLDQNLYTSQLLSDIYREIMFLAQEQSYGYGWVVGEAYPSRSAEFFANPFQYRFERRATREQSYKLVWHWGSNPGFNSIFIRVPDQQWTVIILENQYLIGDNKGTRIYELSAEILQKLDDERLEQ